MSNTIISILDKRFKLSIPNETILEKVRALANKINADYEGKNPVMICILNGAFMFAADLVKCLTFQPEILFAKFASYDGMESTGKVKELKAKLKELKKFDPVKYTEEIIKRL